MGAVLSNLLGPARTEHAELPFLSTLCGVCREVCPVRIDLPRLLLALRRRSPKPPAARAVAAGWRWSMSSPSRYETVARVARAVAKIAPDAMPGGWLAGVSTPFRERGDDEV